MESVVLRGQVPQGSGSGYGSGSGSGYGDGSGYGSGSGSGYGDGSGYGSAEYWAATIQHFAKKWSSFSQLRLESLATSGAKIAFWRSDSNGRAANSGKNSPVSPGTIEQEPGPLPLSCGKGALHATLLPPKWKGERWWIVALIGEVRGDEEKFWALQREIIGECL